MNCCASLSLAKKGVVGKSKNRRRKAEGILKNLLLLRLFIKRNRNVALQRKVKESATFLPVAAGQFCHVFYWLMTLFSGVYITHSPRQQEHLPSRYQCYLAFPSGFTVPFKFAQRISNNLWAFPSGFPIPFSQNTAAVQ
jgi:hypothetical protein